jgi:hypothetical protein
MILGDGTEVRMGNTYGQGEVGDKRGSKEMDRCPLTVFNPDGCSLNCHPLSLVSKFGLLLSWIQTDHNMHCILIMCISYFVLNMIFFEFMYHI